jgi:hypothetical protein
MNDKVFYRFVEFLGKPNNGYINKTIKTGLMYLKLA